MAKQRHFLAGSPARHVLLIVAAAVVVALVWGFAARGSSGGEARSRGPSAGGQENGGAHGLDGRRSGLETPANQPALDRAASEAQTIARGYFAGAIVNAHANSVELYLARAPDSVIDELYAAHRDVYRVVDNNAPMSLSAVLRMMRDFGQHDWEERGVDVVQYGPAAEGYLRVGVSSSVQQAQRAFDATYGKGKVKVFVTKIGQGI